uniref:Uncharacterized protein n=1 Tax=Caenorhabditis japonica TaxID=281687 RepID=A0A8R1ILT0_CAEJA
MTKLGAQQPSVHGGEDLEKEGIKIDPKVFTVLQPTVIPMPAAPHKPASTYNMLRTCFHCIFFATCLLLVAILGVYFLAATPELFRSTPSIDKPQMEALISSNKIDGSSEKSSESIMAVPLARVVVVQDISSNSDEQKKNVVDGSVEEKFNGNMDRPLHPDEIEKDH